MPVFNPPLQYLELAIESVKKQVYENWELCITDDCSTDTKVRTFLERVAASDSRIKFTFREKNGNISKATNSAAKLRQENLLLLDQDDELTPNALAEVSLYLIEHPQCDYLYTDDDKIGEDGKRFGPQFKLIGLLSFAILHVLQSLIVARRSIFNDLGGFRVGYEGSQDYDFALRATEKARHVVIYP